MSRKKPAGGDVYVCRVGHETIWTGQKYGAISCPFRIAGKMLCSRTAYIAEPAVEPVK